MFIHSIPPRPLYLRAKVRQRLERIGAVALKNSVYVLPVRDDTLEDLQWLSGQVVEGGGQAFITRGSVIAGVTDDDLIAAFQSARAADYDALLDEVRASERKLGSGARPADEQLSAILGRFRRRLGEIAAIDFFESPKRKETERMLARLERKQPQSRATGTQKQAPKKGGTWITRRGIKIDRIASAWLVRRFVDPSARFRFVDPESWKKKEGEISFDMTGGDYTHAGNRCTFESIAAAFALRDPALRKIGQIVHDIDLKDERFGRPEAAGVRQVIEGILAANAGDEQRLERGFAVLDDLYSSFSGSRR